MSRNTSARHEMKTWVHANRRHLIAEHQGVHLYPWCIVRLPGRFDRRTATEAFPLAGVSATVDVSGGVSARGTMTRSVIASGWQRKIDTRETWLTIDGPTFQWVIPMPHGHQIFARAARNFARQVNTVARQVGPVVVDPMRSSGPAGTP